MPPAARVEASHHDGGAADGYEGLPGLLPSTPLLLAEVPTCCPLSPPLPGAAAGPATDFNNVGVQEMMKLYYCERRRGARCCRRQGAATVVCHLPHASMPALPLVQRACSRTKRCSSG